VHAKGEPQRETEPGGQSLAESLSPRSPVLDVAGDPDDPSGAYGAESVEQLLKRDIDSRAPADLKTIVSWVFENQSVDDIVPADAPSGGAWSLLEWARDNPKGFMEVWRKTFATVSAIKKQVSDDGRELFDLIDKLRKLAAEAKDAVGNG